LTEWPILNQTQNLLAVFVLAKAVNRVYGSVEQGDFVEAGNAPGFAEASSGNPALGQHY
jgi:hypothetical protein